MEANSLYFVADRKPLPKAKIYENLYLSEGKEGLEDQILALQSVTGPIGLSE